MLAPARLKADGVSTSTATATVTDAQGDPVPGDTVSFSSSDSKDTVSGTSPGAQPGTYTATVNSTDPGQATITAKDTSVTPNVSGSAVLSKYGPASSVTVSLFPASIQANGVSASTATATVTDAKGDPVPGDTVTFTSSDPGQKINPSPAKDNGDGTYTATITSSGTPGQSTITATDSSVSPNRTGMSTLTQTTAGVSVGLNPSSLPADGTSTTTATAVVTDFNGNAAPGHSVVFSSSDPQQKVGSTTDHGNGIYSATITASKTAGQSTITATDQTTGINGFATLTQNAVGSGTTLVSSSSTPVTNESVTLFASVNTNGGSPSGTITFADDGFPLGGCVGKPITPSNPTAVCHTSFAAMASLQRLTATFTPDSSSTVAGSTGAATISVGKDVTSTSLDVSSFAVQVGSDITYTATVTPGHGGPVQPSGPVAFTDGTTPIPGCGHQPLVKKNGVSSATCTVTYGQTGGHTVTATYGGDPYFLGSKSSSTSVDVQPQPVLGTIGATMRWSFYYTPGYTKVLAMVIERVPNGSSVLITCNGQGCPFASSAITVTKLKHCVRLGAQRCVARHPGTIQLGHWFGDHHLQVGTQIIVKILRPNWIGKYYAFVIRPRQGPRIRIQCLAPGRARPGVGC